MEKQTEKEVKRKLKVVEETGRRDRKRLLLLKGLYEKAGKVLSQIKNGK